MKQAEIKTKLTADGSELSRALKQGVSQGADFSSSMRNVGKAIGAAFTVQAIISGLRRVGDEQIKFAQSMADLGKEADAFSKQIENLWERLGNAETVKAANKSMLDFSQSIREVERELANMQKMENLGGMGGRVKDVQDFVERFSREGFTAFDFTSDNQLATADELRIKQLQKQLDLLRRQSEYASEIAKKKASEIEAEQRRLLERSDRMRLTLSADDIKKELASLENEELNLRVAFDLDPTAANRSAVEQSIQEQERLNGLLKQAGEEAQEAGSSLMEFLSVVKSGESEMMSSSAERARQEAASMFDFLSALGDAPGGLKQEQDQRFSDLRRMGANELGSGLPNRGQDKAQAMIDLMKKQVDATGKIPEAIRTIGNFFGVFI